MMQPRQVAKGIFSFNRQVLRNGRQVEQVGHYKYLIEVMAGAKGHFIGFGSACAMQINAFHQTLTHQALKIFFDEGFAVAEAVVAEHTARGSHHGNIALCQDANALKNQHIPPGMQMHQVKLRSFLRERLPQLKRNLAGMADVPLEIMHFHPVEDFTGGIGFGGVIPHGIYGDRIALGRKRFAKRRHRKHGSAEGYIREEIGNYMEEFFQVSQSNSFKIPFWWRTNRSKPKCSSISFRFFSF